MITARESDDGVCVLTFVRPGSPVNIFDRDTLADLGANLGGKIAAPQIVVTPHAELLVFDPSAPKVFRFRMHIETKEPL